VVRPEHLRLGPGGDGANLAGTVTNVVYLGTDTHYHLRLASGEEMVARVQNGSAADRRFGVGEAVDVGFDPAAVRVLRD
jgi:spermidine/putrescine transport system ATP-binding protein